jgi:hypothetical protein
MRNGTAKKSTERAFVIQFNAVEGARGRLSGRVESVASGECVRFVSMKELMRFLVDVVRRPANNPTV